MFTNWAVLICYIIGFNLIVTFLLAVLKRALFPPPPLPYREDAIVAWLTPRQLPCVSFAGWVSASAVCSVSLCAAMLLCKESNMSRAACPRRRRCIWGDVCCMA